MNRDSIQGLEKVIDGQLMAYNQGDYELFCSYYHPSIISYDLEGFKVNNTMCGREFFDHYKNKFKKNPTLHCVVLSRIQHGNLIVDKERITKESGVQYEELVIYEVQDMLISRMWFCKELPCM